jgi:hypothetical protein
MAFFVSSDMNLEMLFHVPFILFIAIIIYSISGKLRKGTISSIWYYLLLLLVSAVVYLILVALLVLITVERSPF